MARLTKASEAILEQFGFQVSTPPEKQDTRRSRYDDLWEAAKTFCENNPGTTIRTREFTNASAAYQEAKAINNGEHRHFKDEGASWLAVAAKDDEAVAQDKDGNEYTPYALWLTFKA